MTEANGSKTAAVTTAGRSPWRVRALVGAVVLLVAVVGYAAWRVARPVSGRLQALAEQVAADPSAFPAPDVRHRVPLDGRYSGITPRDEMYLTRRDDGSVLVLFPIYYGNGTSVSFLLYTSRPLAGSDTYLRQTTLGRTDRVIDAAPYKGLNFNGRIDDHWYRVSFFMD